MLKELKGRLFDHIESQKAHPSLPKNFTIPPTAYSEERFLQESQGLQKFAKSLGPLKSIREGSKFLVRGEGEEVQLFHNACPHRGAKLVSKGKDFVCTYHGWSFDEKGSLKSSTGHVCPYGPGSLKLKEVISHQLGGIVFTGEKNEAGFYEEIQALSDGCEFIEERSFDVKCNWKFLVESLLETYHFPFAHHSILGDFQNAYYSMGASEGLNARILVPLSDLKDGLHEENLKGINIMYHLFPYDFVLFMSSGFVWFRIDPESAGRSVLRSSLFSYGRSEEMARRSLDVLDIILHQDFDVLEGQQENLGQGGRYCLTGYEDLIRIFHQNLNNSLKARAL